MNEQYGKLYAELYGLSCVFLRFFNVYGPRQKAEGGYPSVIPAFIKKVLACEPAKINGSGSISRDFIFVKDIARALRLAVEMPVENVGDNDKKLANNGAVQNFEVFNIAGGTPTALDTLWNTMCEIKGVTLPQSYGAPRVGDIEVSIADVQKAKEKLCFEAHTGLKEGLETLLAN
jgi:nucleoside-diphosphate-sugar epimerase